VQAALRVSRGLCLSCGGVPGCREDAEKDVFGGADEVRKTIEKGEIGVRAVGQDAEEAVEQLGRLLEALGEPVPEV